MKKLLTILLLFALILSQQNIKIVSSLDSFFEEKEKAFYFVYEVKSELESNHSNYWNISNDEDEFLLHELKSDINNTLFVIKYDPIKKNVLMTNTIGSGSKSYIRKNSYILFASVQEKQKAYSFVKRLVSDGHENLSGFLVHYDKKQAFIDYKKMYENASDNDKKKNLLYWTSRIKSDESFDFISSKFDQENNEIRKKAVFCFRNYGKKGYRKLLEIAKSRDHYVSDEARFWIVNSAGKELEKIFSNKIYEKDDISLKESAIFSLYNQNDIKALKKIAGSSKDIRLRKKALFWLGQSKRVEIDFFAEMLNL